MSIILERARPSDWARLYAWRNDQATRDASLTQEPVSLAEHLAWLKETLAKPTTRLYVVRHPIMSVYLGTVRLDALKAGVVEISLTVAPEARGMGHAQAIVRAATSRVAGEFPTARRVKALVRETNYRSLRVFADSGYEVKDVKDGVVTLFHPVDE